MAVSTQFQMRANEIASSIRHRDRSLIYKPFSPLHTVRPTFKPFCTCTHTETYTYGIAHTEKNHHASALLDTQRCTLVGRQTCNLPCIRNMLVHPHTKHNKHSLSHSHNRLIVRNGFPFVRVKPTNE